MIQPFNVKCAGRDISFSLDLDSRVNSDSAIAWYFQQGVPPEPEVVHVMARVIQPGDFVVDAGANVGFFTVLVAQLAAPGGRVLAIEPGHNNLHKFHRNVAINQGATVTHCDQPLALSNSVAFYLTRDNGMNACFPAKDAAATMELPATTLDAICDEVPKLIKMDIEGSELNALKGAEKLLARHPPFIVMELNEKALTAMGTSSKEVRAFMDAAGYQMFWLDEQGAPPVLIALDRAINLERENTNVLFSTEADVKQAWGLS